MVAVFIESSSPPQTNTTNRPPRVSPTVWSSASVRYAMKVVSWAMKPTPSTPTIVSGSSSDSTTLSAPVEAIAHRVSLRVSTNSGANVAGASGPYVDQAITQNQTITIAVWLNIDADV